MAIFRLPSTCRLEEMFAEPSALCAAQMYLPESARVTLRTTSFPFGSNWRLSDKPDPWACDHVIDGRGFPVAEHWNTAFWFSLTVSFIGDIVTTGDEIDSPGSPFAPGNPLGPGSPLTPCSPFSPCGPTGPCFPCGPGSPASPLAHFLPVTPRGPLRPRDPLGPCLPGGPCKHIFSFFEQKTCGVRESKVLFISLLTTSMVSLWSARLSEAKRRVLNLWMLSADKIHLTVNRSEQILDWIDLLSLLLNFKGSCFYQFRPDASRSLKRFHAVHGSNTSFPHTHPGTTPHPSIDRTLTE